MTDDPVLPATPTPVPATPPPPPKYDAISAFIAHQANDAMQAGADPKAVTAKLGQMVAHLRNNPDLHAQANDAILTHGADPLSVASKLASMSATVNYAGDDALGNPYASALRGMTVGLSDKAIAGGEALKDAALAKFRGGDFQGTLGDAYKQNLSAQEAAGREYHTAHPVADVAADMAGGAVPLLLSGGLDAGPEAASVTRLARMGKAIGTGAAFGAANAAGRSDAIEQGRGVSGLAKDAGKGLAYGAAGGALSIPAAGVAGKILQWTGVPKAASYLAGKVGQILPPGALANAAQRVGTALGPEGEPAQMIARNAAMDEQGGFVPQAMHPSVPPMALDAAGPNVEGMAERIVNTKGPGRAIIVQAATDRTKQMRPAITGQLEAGTGVQATDRLNPLQAAIDARTAEAKTNYDAARTATKGQSVASPTFDQIAETPAGKIALKVAQARQGNMFRDAGPSAIPKGIAPERWAELQRDGLAQFVPGAGATPPESTLPDPETLHFMKQHLAALANLGVRDGDSGTLSQSARGALSVWGKVRDELPDTWRAADDAYAARSRIIDMMDRGRAVFNTPVNPAAAGKKAIAKSLGGLDQKIAAAAPEEQQAAQIGAATAAHARLLRAPMSMKSPGTVMAQSPEQIEQLGHAFPTPDKAADFQNAVQSWDRVQAQGERMSGNSRTALRTNLQGNGDLVQPGVIAASRPLYVLRQIINGLNQEYEGGRNKQIDARIAALLTGPDKSALANAQQTGAQRAGILHMLRILPAQEGGQAGGEHAVSGGASPSRP